MINKSVDQIWADDRLGRKADAVWLERFLRRRSDELTDQSAERSLVLNIDERWGEGKSFFLTRLREQLEANGHIAVYVDAWRDDFAEDPLIAVMSAIDSEVAKHVKPTNALGKAWKKARVSGGKVAALAAKGLVVQGASILLTAGVTEAIGAVVASADVEIDAQKAGDAAGGIVAEAMKKLTDTRAKTAINEFEAGRKSMQTFRTNLAQFVRTMESAKDVPPPLFVLVDELDRCRPTYAIALLERIKHLFDTPGVVFVVATNSAELSHSIRAVYGQDFSSREYLKRFFDLTYTFERPGRSELVNFLLQTRPLPGNVPVRSTPSAEHNEFIVQFFEHTNLNTRAIYSAYETLRTLLSTWQYRVPVELLVMLPMIVALREDHSVKLAPPGFEREVKNLVSDVWRFEYQARDDGAYEPKRKSEPIRSMMVTMHSWAQGTLNSVIDQSGSLSLPERWIRDGFGDELTARARTENRSLPFPPNASLVSQYERFVRQAGRVARL